MYSLVLLPATVIYVEDAFGSGKEIIRCNFLLST